jgi:hypothetical protein
MRATAIAIATLLLGLSRASALTDVENLQQFLRSVEEAAQVTAPLRADGQFAVTSPSATRRDSVAMILRPPTDTYIELQQAGIKALVPSSTQALRCTKGAGKAEEFPREAGFADSDFTREDLEPFRAARYNDARISDETASELTVTLAPATSQYSLEVVTFDRRKHVPLKTLYYRDTVSNLVKLRRDAGHVLIGGRWRPTSISMETFKQRTQTTFTLHWAEGATVPPELFDPAALTRPSSVVWPTAATAPAP